MTEIREIPNIPPDSLSLFHGDHFVGSGYFYRSGEPHLIIEEVKFNTPKNITLNPFFTSNKIIGRLVRNYSSNITKELRIVNK